MAPHFLIAMSLIPQSITIGSGKEKIVTNKCPSCGPAATADAESASVDRMSNHEQS
jgi:hypothetical protein